MWIFKNKKKKKKMTKWWWWRWSHNTGKDLAATKAQCREIWGITIWNLAYFHGKNVGTINKLWAYSYIFMLSIVIIYRFTFQLLVLLECPIHSLLKILVLIWLINSNHLEHSLALLSFPYLHDGHSYHWSEKFSWFMLNICYKCWIYWMSIHFHSTQNNHSVSLPSSTNEKGIKSIIRRTKFFPSHISLI